MSQHIDVLVVQYPRGATAMVWCDQAIGSIVTSHAGLRDALRRGIRDWEGHLVCPHDGPIFLSAVYDHFFLNGYSVHWLKLSCPTGVQNPYRV